MQHILQIVQTHKLHTTYFTAVFPARYRCIYLHEYLLFVFVDRQMGCDCTKPQKADTNGTNGPLQAQNQTVSPEGVTVTTHGVNKPPPPAVPPKKREW